MRINWIFPRTNLGGGTKVARQLAEQMQARGHTCTIAHICTKAPWPTPLQPRRLARRLRLEWQIRGREPHHLIHTTVPCIEVAEPRIEARHVPPADVNIATWWETMEWIRDWPASHGKLAYYVQHHELHGGDAERVRATYRAPGLKIVISHWLADVMRREYDTPDVAIVLNGLDFDQFDAPPRTRGQPPRVGLMYSTKHWKRTDLAFEAIGILRERVPEVEVVAFGSMPLEKDPAPPRGLEFFLRPPQDQIAPIYRSCDAWLLASDLEGFGMPGLEAAACRCPVVATRCGGAEEYVRDGISGYLVPPGDAGAMAAALHRVLTASPADWTRMSEASYAEARRFRWEDSAEVLERALLRYVESTP